MKVSRFLNSTFCRHHRLLSAPLCESCQGVNKEVSYKNGRFFHNFHNAILSRPFSSQVPREFEDLFNSETESKSCELKYEDAEVNQDVSSKPVGFTIKPALYRAPSNLPENADFETDVTNPESHIENFNDIMHKFYTVPQDDLKDVFCGGKLCPPLIRTEVDVLSKLSIMIRKPSLEVIHFIRNANLENPPLKVFLYGKVGSGKSMCLMHVMHFVAKQKFLLLPILHLRQHVHHYQEVFFEQDEQCGDESDVKAQQPVNSVQWLSNLVKIGVTRDHLVNLVTQKDYHWGLDETSDRGISLLALCEFGISRPRRASRVISALISEIKQYSVEDKVKVAIIVDEVEKLFRCTNIQDPRIRKTDDGSTDAMKCMEPEQLEMLSAFKTLLQSDWRNAIILGSVRGSREYAAPVTPRSVLGLKGYNSLIPFIPVEVPIYNKTEFLNQLGHYVNARWVQHYKVETLEHIEQIEFLSARHPFRLHELCGFL